MDGDYGTFHRDPRNMLIHIVAVPVFCLALCAGVMLLVGTNYRYGLLSLVIAAVSLGAQAYGHKREATPTEPFIGPFNFLSRILAEQFFRFWKFLLSEKSGV